MSQRVHTPEEFDPSAFHANASRRASGWTSYDPAPKKKGVWARVEKVESPLTWLAVIGIAGILRPVDYMDINDVIWSAISVLACAVPAWIATKVLFLFFKPPEAVQRIGLATLALVLAVGVGSSGVLKRLSVDPDDYLRNVPGYRLSGATDVTTQVMASLPPAASESGGDVSFWRVHKGAEDVAVLGIMVAPGASEASEKEALNSIAAQGANQIQVAGRKVWFSQQGGVPSVSWSEDDAIIFVMGLRTEVEAIAAGFLSQGG